VVARGAGSDWEVSGGKQTGRDRLAAGDNRTTKSFCKTSKLLGSKIVENLENITNIGLGKDDHVHAIVCFERAHKAMCGAFNLVLEELKYPKSSAV
jgi:hypothetical protein